MASPVPALHSRIGAAGVGLAGIDGCWWLPAAEPFALPAALAAELRDLGAAIFALLDVVAGLYGTPAGAACGLDALLGYHVPPDLARLRAPGAVLGLRPDFQLCPDDSPAGYRLVATELEICPSAQGFAHAMQRGYGLETDLVAAYVRILAGRELLIAATAAWGEFVWDQLAFCRALAEAGARARLLLDLPPALFAAQVRRGERWRVPMFGIPTQPERWDDDVLARIERHGFGPFVWHADAWPADVGDARVFRFGYCDCFSASQLARMRQWQARGAAFINPPAFFLDSKAVMAALGLPAVREALAERSPAALPALRRGIPETLLVQPETLPRLRAERPAWVLKYAGFDRGNLAWGGRSLQLGLHHDDATWARLLSEALSLGWPVVAQRLAPTARLDIQYLDRDGRSGWLRAGGTRLRSFLLRDPADPAAALACGTHLTVASGAGVSESTAAVQAPVLFR
ncbi:hypothetical protein [Kouleothrix sp.]|uniref:hypothetical protein n=1 Tax=Kouleothrix sp. TaxID=2779161 RepID=UPI00391DEBCB